MMVWLPIFHQVAKRDYYSWQKRRPGQWKLPIPPYGTLCESGDAESQISPAHHEEQTEQIVIESWSCIFLKHYGRDPSPSAFAAVAGARRRDVVLGILPLRFEEVRYIGADKSYHENAAQENFLRSDNATQEGHHHPRGILVAKKWESVERHGNIVGKELLLGHAWIPKSAPAWLGSSDSITSSWLRHVASLLETAGATNVTTMSFNC
jgi:hypothetical protein